MVNMVENSRDLEDPEWGHAAECGQRRGAGQISKGVVVCSTPTSFPQAKVEGQSFYRCVSAGHGSAEAERFVLLIRRLEAFSVVIQDPPPFICYPTPLAYFRTQTSCIRDRNSDLAFFHFPSYLTCPFVCRVPLRAALQSRSMFGWALSNLIALLRWNSPCE
jgi:hypothetical protein